MKENILWILAFVGIISIIFWCIKLMGKKEKITPNTSLVLKVYNWENHVENFVRFIASSCYFNNNMFCPTDVIFVDMGSTDNTQQIIRKLIRQYSFVKIVDGEILKKNKKGVLDYTKDRCQGDGIIFLDISELTPQEVYKLVKFYFSG